ncbi:MAG: hypothetical protein ACP5UV_07600, partial [Thermoplasmata archaeon]
MAEVKYFAAHSLVSSKFKFSGDPVKMAFGTAIDTAISQHNYFTTRSFRNLRMQQIRNFSAVFRERLREENVSIDRKVFEEHVKRAWRMIFAFSKTNVSNMLRERTRAVIVKGDPEIVMYTQPDFVDYEDFYEMKSFEITDPVQPEVLFQVKLFQLSFYGNANIIGFREEDGYYHAQIVPVPHLEDSEKRKLINDIFT